MHATKLTLGSGSLQNQGVPHLQTKPITNKTSNEKTNKKTDKVTICVLNILHDVCYMIIVSEGMWKKKTGFP